MKLSASRRGDLTLNTIVIAALVLIVLVVLIMIFTGRISIFGEKLGDLEKDCGGRGGKICDQGCGDGQEIKDSEGNTITNCCSLLTQPCD